MPFMAGSPCVVLSCFDMPTTKLRGRMNHPGHTETIGHHAESRRKKRLHERLEHLPAVCQRVEPPVGVRFTGHGE